MILLTPDPAAKVKAARPAARAWRGGRLDWRFDVPMPDCPMRGDRPALLPASQMPRRGSGSDRNRIAMLHALAHIEYVAIDLAFDLIGRFGAEFPRAFVDEWMRVGGEEAMHFALLDRRLRAMGAAYGDLPAHDGLWEAAEATASDSLARLAIVPMVLEARGLDVTPATIMRFKAAGDARSATILGRILNDEIRHVATGVNGSNHFVQRSDSRPPSIGGPWWADISGGVLSLRSTTQRVQQPVYPGNSMLRVAVNDLASHKAPTSSREGQFS